MLIINIVIMDKYESLGRQIAFQVGFQENIQEIWHSSLFFNQEAINLIIKVLSERVCMCSVYGYT